jgi:CubicO group peptidase (beta-lactamase class C family)
MNLLKLLLTSFIGIMGISVSVRSQSSEILFTHTIDSILLAQVQQKHIPGAVVLIKKDGKILYQQAYGYARLFNNQHQLLRQQKWWVQLRLLCT